MDANTNRHLRLDALGIYGALLSDDATAAPDAHELTILRAALMQAEHRAGIVPTPTEFATAAAAVRGLSCVGPYAKIDLSTHGNRAPVDAIVAAGGRRSTHPYEMGKLIESADLSVDGVTFHAQMSRFATDEEIAAERASERAA